MYERQVSANIHFGVVVVKEIWLSVCKRFKEKNGFLCVSSS